MNQEKKMYRIWRHPNSKFGVFSNRQDELQDETVTANSTYSDDKLAEIATSGFNGIWVHGLLHNMIHGDNFPEFGINSDVHLTNMNALIARASKHNIKVFLYMQPPRAIPIENKKFWNNHLDVAGECTEQKEDNSNRDIKLRSLCTSTPKVRQYLESALANLTEALPDLGGYIFISASEYAAHCYSRRNCRPDNPKPKRKNFDPVPVQCPNCSLREPEEVIIELLSTLRNGIRKQSPDIPIIFWNWSWTMYVDPPCREIISQLPQDTCLLAGFERGGKMEIYGHGEQLIDEYSLSYAGPSEQFIESMQLAQQRGLEIMPKLQIGTTHELASVVSLPLLGNVFKKANFIRKNKLKGFMGCWNFGNQQSANTVGFNYFCSQECPDDEHQALMIFAASYLTGCDAEKVVKAWQKFEKAMRYFPFCIPFLYMAPTNYALAMLPKPGKLSSKSAGRSWLMDERGDDLSAAITDFSLTEIIDNFDTLNKIWEQGVYLLQNSLTNADHANAKNELDNAEICGAVWRSTNNAFKLYELRLNWQDENYPEYYKIIKNELANVAHILPIVSRDSRQGFHIEAHGYMFNAEKIKHKINIIENQLSNPIIM
jgi:hypothetical protein